MRTFIEEYGMVILYAIIGISVLLLLSAGIRNWYDDTYPTMEDQYQLVDTQVAEEPIMIVTPIEILRRDTAEDIDYTDYVVAYSNADKTEVIEPDVLGVEEIDITTKGLYTIFYLVTNDSGQSLLKEVPVLIY